MSTRWSYGPNGLREVPVESRWNAEHLWPRWRELQPLLLRSAGVVGLAGMIVAVLAANGWRADDEAGRSPEPVVLHAPDGAGGEPSAVAPEHPPLIEAAAQSAEPEALPTETSAALPIAEAAFVVEPAPAEGPETAAAVEPQATASVTAADQSAAPREVAAVTFSELRTVDTAVVSARSEAGKPEVAAEVLPVEHIGDAARPTGDDASAAVADAGAPEPSTISDAPAAAPHASAEMSVAMLQPADEARFIDIVETPADEPAVPADETAADASAETSSIWAEGGAHCLRDWVGTAADAPSTSSGDCAATSMLIASTGDTDQSAIEEAATEHARELAALLPFVPRPRPEPPADFKPEPRKARVARHDLSWPAEPPPDCGNLHAYWRFVDRKAGTKEWYCR